MKSRLLLITGSLSLALCAFTLPSAAGENNTLYILQESPSGAATGNTLSVDQSLASNSLITGLESPDPAIQRGSGNELDIEITGDGGEVRFLQNNSGVIGGTGNFGTINAGANTVASLLQTGDKNQASLIVQGLSADGSITQDGLGNAASLNVNGDGASGSIKQQGNNNDVGLSVQGAGTSASYTQTGNSLTSASVDGVQVISNGATVSITQSTF